jgi:murein DD-endopeptidase MepM/ murein hydrolase activator NlpD
MLTYWFLHGSIDGFDGLNYVLVALAFGGFFIVANRHGFFFVSLAIITTGMIDLASNRIMSVFDLEPLVLAFNITTLMFLLPLKLFPLAIPNVRLITVPLYLIKSPETNLKWYRRWSGQKTQQRTILTLPFLGEWSVLQGNNGEWTHKGIGKYAWDFVVRDERGHQASGFGNELTDFYAFSLPVLAPAIGTVYAIENSVQDNPPQTANTEQNWGNYVIINHGNNEFTELSHFKQWSIIVVPGQVVTRGQILGYCGNSGRSPVPHIHMQLQSSPVIGAPTIPSNFSEGMLKGETQLKLIPEVGDKVSQCDIEGEEFSLLGRETESWTFEVNRRFIQFKEQLTFSTDEYGLPAITSANNRLWRILEYPNFIEIKPDFKTYSSLISPSGFMEVIGEGLVIPKRLSDNLIWSTGKINKIEDCWILSTNGRTIKIDINNGIESCEILDNEKFSFKQINRVKPK